MPNRRPRIRSGRGRTLGPPHGQQQAPRGRCIAINNFGQFMHGMYSCGTDHTPYTTCDWDGIEGAPCETLSTPGFWYEWQGNMYQADSWQGTGITSPKEFCNSSGWIPHANNAGQEPQEDDQGWNADACQWVDSSATY